VQVLAQVMVVPFLPIYSHLTGPQAAPFWLDQEAQGVRVVTENHHGDFALVLEDLFLEKTF